MSKDTLRAFSRDGKVVLQFGPHEWDKIELPAEEGRRLRDQLTMICRHVAKGRGYYFYDANRRKGRHAGQISGGTAKKEGAAAEGKAAG